MHFLLVSSNSPASASQVAGITGACCHAWLIFMFWVEMGFHHVGQAGLELLTSSDPSASASQNAGITGMSYHVHPFFFVTGSCAISQARVQWCDFGLLQPPHSGLNNPPVSASQVVLTTGVCHHARLNFVFLLETGFCYVILSLSPSVLWLQVLATVPRLFFTYD